MIEQQLKSWGTIELTKEEAIGLDLDFRSSLLSVPPLETCSLESPTKTLSQDPNLYSTGQVSKRHYDHHKFIPSVSARTKSGRKSHRVIHQPPTEVRSLLSIRSQLTLMCKIPELR